MKLKILLLVISLALLQPASATIFINQTSATNTVTLPPTDWIGNNFTVPSYSNASTYSLDYVEILAQRALVGTTIANMTVSNDTYLSQNTSVSITNTLTSWRFNFSDVLLVKGNVYNFTVYLCSGCGSVTYSYANTNPYSGGELFLDGVAFATDDLTFNISLSPHDTVGNWTFNQASGAYANDSSPFFNNGTLNTSGTFWSTNLVNGSVNSTSLQFDGTGGNVSIPFNLSLNVTQMTFSAWIKTSDTKAIQFIGGHGDTAFNGWFAYVATGNVIHFKVGNGAANGEQTVAYSTGSWAHIAGTYDGSNVKLYLNGVVQPSVALTGDIFYNSVSNMTIGCLGSVADGCTSVRYFNGTIDEVKLYNYALNQSEITAIYQQFQPVPAYPVGGLQINPSSATAYVNFSWHDTVYPQDEIIIATDSGFANVVHDAFHSTDYANISLTVATQYYWKVRQFDSGTGSYGNTSAIQTFILGTVPTFIRVNVFDELNLTPLININATLTSIATNVSVNLSSAGSYVNFTNPSITDGVEYLAQVGAIGYTTRNILITSPGNYSIYLPYTATSTGVSQINFVESDYTGLFPYQSTKLIVQKVINTSLVNISSNYFDATGLSTAQLINGQLYQLVVESTVSTRVLGSFIPTASATQTLLIGTFTLQPSSAFNGLVYNFTYNSNQSIVLQWNDPNNEIISLNETITNQLNAIVLQLITSVHSGQTTYLIANTSSKYLVQLNVSTAHYGYLLYSLWYNPALFTSSTSSVAPTPGPNNFVIPFGNTTNVSTTSNANAPIPQWVKNFFSVSVLVVMALLFNREHVLRGAVVVSLFSLVFWLTGMLVFDVGYITTGAILGMGFVISVVALLAESNRG